MLRNDGTYTIYEIQHQQNDKKWVFTNLDTLEKPRSHEETFSEPWRSFTACGECWQETGEFGCYDMKTAILFLLNVIEHCPKRKFRLVKINITQKTEHVLDIGPMKVTNNENNRNKN